jgi:signal peptidase
MVQFVVSTPSVRGAAPGAEVRGARWVLAGFRRVCTAGLQALTLATAGLFLMATAPAFAGFHAITVAGGSMGDALPVGSVAVTRTVSAGDVRVGDVIAFRRSESAAPTLHRVVAIEEREGRRVATTRGDANATDDYEPLALERSGERVLYYVPWAGYLFALARSGASRLLIAGLAAVLAARIVLSRRGSRRDDLNAAIT